MKNQIPSDDPAKNAIGVLDYVKFIIYSTLGVVLFFIPVTINGTSSIPLDHLITYLNNTFPLFGSTITLVIGVVGGMLPWINGSFKRNTLNFILSVLRLLSVETLSTKSIWLLGIFLKIRPISPYLLTIRVSILRSVSSFSQST